MTRPGIALLTLLLAFPPALADESKPLKLTADDDKKEAPFERKRRGNITIGKETTYATGPLDKHGYVDYAAALNERMGKAVAPGNNANVLLWKALGPNPDGGKPMHPEFFQLMGMKAPPEKGEYFIDVSRFAREQLKIKPAKEIEEIRNLQSRVAQQSWTAPDHPNLASWLKANEKPLALVVEATKRTQYFSPLVTKSEAGRTGTLLGARTPGVDMCRELAHALAARASLRVGEGRCDDAWEDLLACHRLGRLVGRGGTYVEGMVGIAIDGIASKADLVLLNHPQLKASQIQKYLQDLQRIPPMFEMADKFDVGERFTFLDEVCMVDFYGLDYLESLSATGAPRKPDALVKRLREQVMDGLDWDPALRNANRWFDRYVTAMRVKDRSDREKKLIEIDEELKTLRGGLLNSGELAQLLKGDEKERGTVLGNIMICMLIPAITKVQESVDRSEQVQRNLHVAFALAAYQRENGRYPASLDAVTPRYLPKIPNDLFTGRPLIYRSSEKGYLLYSFGPNGKDDEGRGKDDEPNGDDLAVKMPLLKTKD